MVGSRLVAPSRGTVFNIQRFSVSDGPGIRTTVFLKGCPLRCPWCHNPEGLGFAPQLAVRAQRCVSCSSCTEACPSGCDPVRCTACGRCAEVCPTAAREMLGRVFAADQLLAEVLRDRLFFDLSGGGVTFSGGEPLAQPDFLLDCLERCRGAGVHTAVDTSGCCGSEVLIAVAALTDLFLYDVKAMDPARHAELVGTSMERVIGNLDKLARHHDQIWLRIPVIPGISDLEEHLFEAARLAASLPAVRKVCLLPYHRTGTAKAVALDGVDEPAAFKTPSQEHMQRLAALVESAGVEVSIGG